MLNILHVLHELMRCMCYLVNMLHGYQYLRYTCRNCYDGRMHAGQWEVFSSELSVTKPKLQGSQKSKNNPNHVNIFTNSHNDSVECFPCPFQLMHHVPLGWRVGSEGDAGREKGRGVTFRRGGTGGRWGPRLDSHHGQLLM